MVAKKKNGIGTSAGDDRFSRALLLLGLRNMPFKEQAVILDRAGFGPTEIADLTGSTKNSVSVRLAEYRRGKGKNG